MGRAGGGGLRGVQRMMEREDTRGFAVLAVPQCRKFSERRLRLFTWLTCNRTKTVV